MSGRPHIKITESVESLQEILKQQKRILAYNKVQMLYLFGSSVLIVLIFQGNAKEVMPVFQNLLNFSNQNHTFLRALI